MNVFLYNAEHNPIIYTEEAKKAFRDGHDLRIYDANEALADQLKGVDAVVDVGGWGTDEMIEAARDARLWQILGQGLDHTDVELIKSKGIMVCNCPASTTSVGLAECAIMYMLMLVRKFHEGTVGLKEGRIFQPMGQSLDGLTLGLIGFGASAQELAKRARPFGMRIEAIEVRDVDSEIKPDFLGGPDDLDEMIRRSDFLSLHLPLMDKTQQIIDARRIALMKPSAFLINVARGDLVDEQALHEAVLGGKIAGTGLDVYSEEPPDVSGPFFDLPNVVLTPHFSGCTDHVVQKRIEFALDNVNLLAQGLEPLCRVDK